ncbi:hypothetical protein [Bacillus marasmi]|uniref:hypothetical protein n=1 Tax=Bacillus marasmi TaxID=1926279 RepID=UPI001FE54741|nr:hypothetical protein [Bacillus marasmi]
MVFYVKLEAKKVGGKKYVVDSYVPNKEIVSRKFTQLSEVQERTATSYLNEITKKYPSGSTISNGTFNPNALKGGRLKGELVLEVPVQDKLIPQIILDEATKNRIIIRDIIGKVIVLIHLMNPVLVHIVKCRIFFILSTIDILKR